MTAATPLLDSIKCPADLRGLHAKQLRQLADELRAETISAVAVTDTWERGSASWSSRLLSITCSTPLMTSCSGTLVIKLILTKS